MLSACATVQYRNLDTDVELMQSFIGSKEIINVETTDGNITPMILTGYVDKTMIGIHQEDERKVEIDVYNIQVIHTDESDIYPSSTEPVANIAGAIGGAILYFILLIGILFI